MATEACLDGDGGGRRERLQGIGWHSQPQTMALPLISFPCSQCHCGAGHNVSSSDGGWRERQGVHIITLTHHTGYCYNNEYQNTDNSHYTSTYHTSFQGCLQPPSSPSPDLPSLPSLTPPDFAHTLPQILQCENK